MPRSLNNFLDSGRYIKYLPAQTNRMWLRTASNRSTKPKRKTFLLRHRTMQMTELNWKNLLLFRVFIGRMKVPWIRYHQKDFIADKNGKVVHLSAVQRFPLLRKILTHFIGASDSLGYHDSRKRITPMSCRSVTLITCFLCLVERSRGSCGNAIALFVATIDHKLRVLKIESWIIKMSAILFSFQFSVLNVQRRRQPLAP